jgi:hypothetical protein
MIQALQLEGFILENVQLLLWAAKNPWPPPFPNMSTGTLDFFLANRAANIVWTWCRLANLHGSLGSINWTLEEQQGQVILPLLPWPSFRCHCVAAYPILFWKVPTGHPHEDSDGSRGSFVLPLASLSSENQMLYRLRINQVPAQLFVTKHWAIPWEPGDDSPGHNLMENFTSLTGHFIQRDSEMMPWKNPWLFSYPVYLKLELGGAISSVSTLCCDQFLVLTCGSSSLVAVLQVRERDMHVIDPIVLPGIPICYFLGKYIKVKKQPVNICASTPQAMSLTKIQPMKQVSPVLLTDQNNNVCLEHLWDPGGLILRGWHLQQLKEIMSTTNSVSIVVSGQQSVNGYACDLCEHSIDQLAMEETRGCVIFLQPKPPWSLAPNTIFRSSPVTVSECTTSLALNQFGFESTSSCLRMEPSGCWTFKSAFWFSWDISWTIDSEAWLKHITPTFSCALRYWEIGDSFSVAMLLVSSNQSQALVIYLPVAAILPWRSKMMPWEISRSTDGILTYAKRVPISWDPGASDPVLAAHWNITQLQYSHLPWDPGGSASYRLGVKPSFKAGGLSATTLLGWPVGRFSWAVACPRARRGGEREAYNRGRQLRETRLGSEGKGGLGRGAWLGECCVCL